MTSGCNIVLTGNPWNTETGRTVFDEGKSSSTHVFSEETMNFSCGCFFHEVVLLNLF